MKLIYIGNQNSFLKKYGEKYLKFYFLSPQEDSYTVEYVKHLIKTYFFYNNITLDECIVFLKSETFTPIVQNMLLKLIEETERNIVFISKKNIFLKTVLSRMQIEYDKDLELIQEQTVSKLFQNTHELVNTVKSKDKKDRQAYLESVEYLISQCKDVNIIMLLEDVYRKIKANCNIDSVIIDFQFKLRKNEKKI
ncbi:MAG: hypothetical protein N3A71_01395 [Candidatus Dojkabacteria bacterium]|nr:hypothetical protein [Candidatus Dojkabacteria bacterium]